MTPVNNGKCPKLKPTSNNLIEGDMSLGEIETLIGNTGGIGYV